MSMGVQPPAPVRDRRPPRDGRPRWVVAVLIGLAVLALVAVVVAVTAEDDETSSPTATAEPGPPAGAPEQIADGCLGGVTDLDRAVLDAQRQAPITAEGAAEFTATLMRWAFLTPASPRQAEIAPQILADDATTKARELSGTIDPEGTTSALDFTEGRYYIESFNGSTAVVSYLAGLRGTKDGQTVRPALVGGGVHLRAVNDVWRYEDLTFTREIREMERLGTQYAEGC